MRLPLTWLHEYTTPDLPVRDLATRLAMTGTEVDRIHLHGVPDTANFVVGRVLSAEQHPDADRLKVCMVDVGDGDGEPQQIVCGAPNVAAGQTVGVARPRGRSGHRPHGSAPVGDHTLTSCPGGACCRVTVGAGRRTGSG